MVPTSFPILFISAITYVRSKKASCQPYPKVRKKYAQNMYKVRTLYVPQSVPRTRGVLSRKRGVISRTKTRTDYVFPGFFGLMNFKIFLDKT